MLSPDLLDRRALALIRLVDVFGRPVDGPVRIEGEDVRTVAKGQGAFAILAAAGLAEHVETFEQPPAAPALRSRRIQIDLTPAAAGVAPRRFELRLPRDPEPANMTSVASLFQAVEIELLPSPRAPLGGSACAVRVTVRRQDDGRRIENALVRAQSDNGQFAARALTDARGEACLIVPTLPLAFPGAGANVQPDLPGRVAVTVDPSVARFHAPADAAAIEAAALRTSGHADPDAIGTTAPDFAGGQPVRLAAGRQPSLSFEWDEP